MDFTNILATFTLTATQTPERASTTGTTTLGLRGVKVKYTDGDAIAVLRKIRMFGSVSPGIQLTGGVTTDANTYVAAVAQVETATAAGTITLAGNATVTVTAAGLTGSPLAISVPVLLSDTAATWAGKVRTALTANAAIAAMFTVGGTTTAISLTRILADDYGHANDATLNIALANGTSTGITAAPTSTNTTTGAVASGFQWDVTVNEDGEGITLPTGTALNAIVLSSTVGTATYTMGASAEVKGILPATGSFNLHASSHATPIGTNGDLTITNTNGALTEIIVCVVLTLT